MDGQGLVYKNICENGVDREDGKSGYEGYGKNSAGSSVFLKGIQAEQAPDKGYSYKVRSRQAVDEQGQHILDGNSDKD